VVAALLGLAAVVRVSAMFYQGISGDDATVALMAKHILRGENWPVFFYRQAFMGSLNGFHLVPGLFAFGPSVLLVRLNAVAWALLFPLGLYVLARRLYGETAARLTLVLAAVPPFLLTYYSTVAEPHFETNTFGVVLLLLALALLEAPAGGRRLRAAACLGFVAGLACWTNMKTVVVLGPIGMVWLWRDPWWPVRREGGLFAAGLLVGNLPAWLFYLTQPDPGQGNLGSARRFLEADIDLSWARLAEFLTNAVPLVVGTYYWDPGTPLRLLALGLCLAVYATAVGLAGVEAVRAVRSGRPVRSGLGAWLLLLTLVATNAALYGSTFNLLQQMSRGRYLLPAYIPLLIFVGAAIARLAGRSRWAAGVVLAFVLAFNLWTNFVYFWPLHPAERARRRAEISARNALGQHLEARSAEAILVDDPMESLRWQFLLSRPRISALETEVYYPAATPTDAADRVALLASHRNSRIPASLQMLDATATATQFGEEWLYEDVRVPEPAYRLLPRVGWRALGEGEGPPAAADGDLGTVWPPRRLDQAEAGQLVMDLGAARSVARLIIWPTASVDVLVPLEVAGSLDGIAWQRLGVTPAEVGEPGYVVGTRPLFRPRNGWLDLVMDPRPSRYLRIRPLVPGSVGVGMVGELYAYEAADRPPEKALDLDALLRALHHRGVTRLLADPVVSARVAMATNRAIATPPANGVLNSHGFAPSMLLYTRVRLRDTDAAVVPVEDAADLQERLATAGLRVTVESLGPYVLVQTQAPLLTGARCRPADWRVTGETPDPDGKGARYVVEARWPAAMRLGTVRFEHPRVSTRDVAILAIGVTADAGAWRAVTDARAVPEWAWAGRTLFTFSGGSTELALGGLSGRAVRLEVHLPYRGAGAITSLCVREQP
jgi:4-amino-4-deoxy-L-arabinose transferase-like glycosyltransferase